MAAFTMYRDLKREFRWNLKADNGLKIADSGEGYTTKENCEHGIALVKQLAPTATVIDQTN